MQLRLNVYTDETMKDISRTCEADKLKIPYRIAMYLIQSLDSVNLDREEDLLKFITGNVEKMDKIIKATFGVNDSELDCIDAGELIGTLKELYQWGIEKVNSLKNEKSVKNVEGPVNS